MSGTVRDNIFFGKDIDMKSRYVEVLKACALDVDLSLMIGGDLTHIGEKRVNLSGGQRARIALTRVIYHGSDIVLLDDDVLSAVDAEVATWILNNCIVGPLTNHKTHILCTHNAQRQVGFWKSEATPSHHGNESDASSLLEKNHSVRGTSVEYLELPLSYISKDKKTKLNVENHLLDSERRSNLSMTKAKDQNLGSESSLCMQPVPVYLERSKVELNGTHYENSLFSSSLSEIFTKKLRLASNGVLFGQSVNLVTPHLEEGPFESLKEVEAQTIGNLLPDDDDLFSGMLDDLEYIAKPTTEDDIEEFDLFSSGGRMELEAADSLNVYGFNNSSEFLRGISNGPNWPFAGEHPSRTLFVRNINSIVEDFELRALFEQYGDIRNLYTACKHRGFIIISYYDIWAARNAMRALQNKSLKQKKLNIHFSIPKCLLQLP